MLYLPASKSVPSKLGTTGSNLRVEALVRRMELFRSPGNPGLDPGAPGAFVTPLNLPGCGLRPYPGYVTTCSASLVIPAKAGTQWL